MTIREELAAAAAADPAAGMVDRQIFSSEELFAKELDRVFAPSWTFVGHTSQLPNDGDFVLSRVGPESVIVARDKGGAINVLLNSCRHRGMPVCRYDDGNGVSFICSYHGWSYGLGGDLTGVPKFAERYRGELDREEWGLIRRARRSFTARSGPRSIHRRAVSKNTSATCRSICATCCKGRTAKTTATK